MTKYNENDIKYKGETNGVHTWSVPSGQLTTGIQIGYTLPKMRQGHTQKKN